MIEESGHELVKKAQQEWRQGRFSEDTFTRCICKVIELAGVEYRREEAMPVSGSDGAPRRCDVYIPKTDTAIEVKTEASLRGVGQCAYYLDHVSEAVLVADGDPAGVGDTKAVRAACEKLDAVTYSLAIPGPHRTPPVLKILSDGSCELFNQAAAGRLGDHSWLSLTPLEVGDD